MPPKATVHTLDPLPAAYYYFFWAVEPFLTLLGALSCILTPEKYAADLLPAYVEPLTRGMGATSRGQMVIGHNGSCFILLGMISFSYFYFVKHHVVTPSMQEGMVKALLVPLAIADLIHIGLTLLPLPISLLKNPSHWTVGIHGNVSITAFLFAYRTAWFLGLGRTSSAPVAAPKPRAKREPKAATSPSGGHTSAASDNETVTPAKRKPGRPRKSLLAEVDTPGPASPPTAASGSSFKAYEVQTPATAKRGRGRPRKAAE